MTVRGRTRKYVVRCAADPKVLGLRAYFEPGDASCWSLPGITGDMGDVWVDSEDVSVHSCTARCEGTGNALLADATGPDRLPHGGWAGNGDGQKGGGSALNGKKVAHHVRR